MRNKLILRETEEEKTKDDSLRSAALRTEVLTGVLLGTETRRS